MLLIPDFRTADRCPPIKQIESGVIFEIFDNPQRWIFCLKYLIKHCNYFKSQYLCSPIPFSISHWGSSPPDAVHSHESGSEDDPGSGRGCRTLQIFSPPTYIATLMRGSHQNLPLSTLPKVAESIVMVGWCWARA
ncbi:Uncharacterized protein HZ326_26525 [Fusarium oxysporum f. sp. albedinis]|nr:Uncharacterized protein HZ326_26525 [Fusarium oxysporum f. sp. albedinis]